MSKNIESKKDQMKIAYLTTRFPKLSESFIYNEIEVLRDLGINIQTYSNRHPFKEELTSNLFKHIENTFYLVPPKVILFIFSHLYWLFKKPIPYICLLVSLIFQPHPRLKDRVFTFFHFLEGVYLASRLILDKIKHIHVHLATGAVTVALVASKLTGLSYSFTAHGSALLINPILLDIKVRNAKFVVAVSNFNREYIIKKVGEDISKKIYVLHCGVNTDEFKPTYIEMSNSDNIQFLTVGRLIWQKAQHIMIESFARLRSKDIPAMLKIIGEGPCRSFLERNIKRLKLQNDVILIGAKPSNLVKKEYNNADIFIISSISEGIPVSLMEAMSCGLPVIATRITGIPDLVENGKNGMLVDPNNATVMAEAMMKLADDLNFRERLGINARITIEKDFDIHRNASRLGLLFKRVVP